MYDGPSTYSHCPFARVLGAPQKCARGASRLSLSRFALSRSIRGSRERAAAATLCGPRRCTHPRVSLAPAWRPFSDWVCPTTKTAKNSGHTTLVSAHIPALYHNPFSNVQTLRSKSGLHVGKRVWRRLVNTSFIATASAAYTSYWQQFCS